MNDEAENQGIYLFQTNTGRLYYGGAKLLPTLAAEYSDLSRQVWATRGQMDSAFATNQSPTGRLNPIYQEWNTLRGSLQDILAKTSTNLVGTGKALCDFAAELSENDDAGAREIAKAGEISKSADVGSVTVNPPKTSADAYPSESRERHRGSRA